MHSYNTQTKCILNCHMLQVFMGTVEDVNLLVSSNTYTHM